MTNTVRIEKAILVALVNNLSAAGFKPAALYIEDGLYIMPGEKSATLKEITTGSEPERITYGMSPEQVCETLFEVYDTLTPTIHFTHKNLTTWGNRGVMVVVGNGKDFISDWHSGDAAFNSIIETVCDAAEHGALTLAVK